jgi:hypothetical protein
MNELLMFLGGAMEGTTKFILYIFMPSISVGFCLWAAASFVQPKQLRAKECGLNKIRYRFAWAPTRRTVYCGMFVRHAGWYWLRNVDERWTLWNTWIAYSGDND